MSNNKELWFAARTRRDQEIAVRDRLKKLSIEHFVPVRTVVRQLRYRRKKAEVPVIRNLVFVRATKEKALAIPNEYGVQLFYMKDMQTRTLLVVPDRQMQDFMLVMDIDPDGVCIHEGPFETGSRVEVVKGAFAGMEGELVSVANRSHVTIRIANILSVNVRIPKSHLRKIPVK